MQFSIPALVFLVRRRRLFAALVLLLPEVHALTLKVDLRLRVVGIELVLAVPQKILNFNL